MKNEEIKNTYLFDVKDIKPATGKLIVSDLEEIEELRKHKVMYHDADGEIHFHGTDYIENGEFKGNIKVSGSNKIENGEFKGTIDTSSAMIFESKQNVSNEYDNYPMVIYTYKLYSNNDNKLISLFRNLKLNDEFDISKIEMTDITFILDSANKKYVLETEKEIYLLDKKEIIRDIDFGHIDIEDLCHPKLKTTLGVLTIETIKRDI